MATANQWGPLYKLAGFSAILTLASVPIQTAVFIGSPPPTTALGWFDLFDRNPILGLLSFEFPIILGNLFAIPLYIAFFKALKGHAPSVMIVATTLGLLGAACIIASRPAFEMLYLSGRYTSAVTGTQRAMYLAAGEGVYAVFHGTLANVGYVLVAVAPSLISFVMLRSGVFSRACGLFGLAANLLPLGVYIPGIGIYLGILSCFPLLMIWDWLLARTFFRLAAEPE